MCRTSVYIHDWLGNKMEITEKLNGIKEMVTSATGLEPSFLDMVDFRLQSFSYDLKNEDAWTIGFLTQSTTNRIKNECHIVKIPNDLYFVMVDMVCGAFLAEKKARGQLSEEQEEMILKSINEGDTTITYADKVSRDTQLSQAFDTMRFGHRAKWLRYRRLQW